MEIYEKPIPFKVDRVVEDMSNQEYHSHGSEIISSSFVKSVLKNGSVGHALTPFTGNAATEFGTFFHDLMELTPINFMDHYEVLSESQLEMEARALRGEKATKNLKATSEYKTCLANLQESAEAEDKTLINEDVYKHIMIMRENVVTNEAYKSLYQFGKPVREHSYFGSFNGLQYRMRFDLGFLMDGSLVALADYKTCKSLKDFEADLIRSVKYKGGWRYDVQAVFYSDFVGVDPSNFYFVAVEKEYPFSTGVYALSEDSIEKARADFYIAHEKIKDWKITGDIGNIQEEIVRI